MARNEQNTCKSAGILCRSPAQQMKPAKVQVFFPIISEKQNMGSNTCIFAGNSTDWREKPGKACTFAGNPGFSVLQVSRGDVLRFTGFLGYRCFSGMGFADIPRLLQVSQFHKN
ncbi:hypothetical protein [Gorillibacterium massiliense]|uniref:hypothetical protein n=1 Tax=Gorillibacterium massiliense TaxID=1280390 RepID=UPI0012DE76B0|nr:hypothetical protein [Gorillibacterium massiliense]